MASDEILDIYVATWPMSALKVEPLSIERRELYWKYFRHCWHNLELGTCDDPDCIVRFVMFS